MLALTLYYLQLLCFCDSWLTCNHFRAVHVHLGYLQKQMRPWWLLWSELIFIMMVWFYEAYMWAAGQQLEKYKLEEQMLKKKKRSTILKENYLPHQPPGFWVGWNVEMGTCLEPVIYKCIVICLSNFAKVYTVVMQVINLSEVKSAFSFRWAAASYGSQNRFRRRRKKRHSSFGSLKKENSKCCTFFFDTFDTFPYLLLGNGVHRGFITTAYDVCLLGKHKFLRS